MDEILEYWNREDVQSMYDKHLLNQEIDLIIQHVPLHSKILDAGCGEGEGTAKYSEIQNVYIHAADFSATRLKKAKSNLFEKKNVKFFKTNFLADYQLDKDYDIVITQRFLINLINWENQKKVIQDFVGMLKPSGLLIMLEGSQEGVDELNNFRRLFNLPPIPVKWHNCFLHDHILEEFLRQQGMELLKKDGLGEYYFLTRALRPIFEKQLNWDSVFNQKATSNNLKHMLSFRDKFSRIKLWVAEKKKPAST